jgi:hypothetical protein
LHHPGIWHDSCFPPARPQVTLGGVRMGWVWAFAVWVSVGLGFGLGWSLAWGAARRKMPR